MNKRLDLEFSESELKTLVYAVKSKQEEIEEKLKANEELLDIYKRVGTYNTSNTNAFNTKEIKAANESYLKIINNCKNILIEIERKRV